MTQVQTTKISHFHQFQAIPNAFSWIQIWCIRWKRFDMDPRSSSFCQKHLHLVSTMNWRTIPKDKKLSGNTALQMVQERNCIEARNSIGSDHGIQMAYRTNPTHYRKMISGQRNLQQWRTAPRCIGSYRRRQKIKTRFINKYYRSLFATGFFLKNGQTVLRQCRIPASSRCFARVTGFCGVQSICLRRRPTWSGWYDTPNSCSMTFATRAHVHTLPRKPYDSAPCQRKSGIMRFCASVNFDGAPERCREYRDSGPLSLALLHHLLTAASVTPKASAISNWRHPFFFSFNACKRRASTHLREDRDFVSMFHNGSKPFAISISKNLT